MTMQIDELRGELTTLADEMEPSVTTTIVGSRSPVPVRKRSRRRNFRAST
jgi:hypothetical protein